MFVRGNLYADQLIDEETLIDHDDLDDDQDNQDDGQETPRTAVGTVKWYDRTKGYGFVVPQDGGDDIMVHEKCLVAIGRAALQGGERLSVVFRQGDHGCYALSVRELAAPVQLPGGTPCRPSDYAGPGRGEGPLRPARVKWFDRQRGFGFVTVFGHGEDIFLHMQTVRRCGLDEIADGEAVAVRTIDGPRGTMVSDLRLWDAGLS